MDFANKYGPDYHRTDFFRFDEYLCSLNFYNIDKK